MLFADSNMSGLQAIAFFAVFFFVINIVRKAVTKAASRILGGASGEEEKEGREGPR